MKKMEDVIDNGHAHGIMSLGWDTIANWGIGAVGAMVAFIVWLIKIIIHLLFKNWKTGRDEMEKRIEEMEKKMDNFEEVIYFEDPHSHEKTHIRRYVVHGFNNQKDASRKIMEYLQRLFDKEDNE